jgi:hypothetical protein
VKYEGTPVLKGENQNTAPVVHLVLEGNVTDCLSFLRPLTVLVEKAEDQIVISDDVFLRYGAGKTQAEALQDYLDDLVQYYQLVEANAAEFSEDAQLLQAMRGYISIHD